jgi:hypothetical protein
MLNQAGALRNMGGEGQRGGRPGLVFRMANGRCISGLHTWLRQRLVSISLNTLNELR